MDSMGIVARNCGFDFQVTSIFEFPMALSGIADTQCMVYLATKLGSLGGKCR